MTVVKVVARVRIVVRTGRNRIVRRMMAHAGLHVQQLMRSKVGPLHLLQSDCGPQQPDTAAGAGADAGVGAGAGAGAGATAAPEPTEVLDVPESQHVRLSEGQVRRLWEAGGGRTGVVRSKLRALREHDEELGQAGQPNERLRRWLAWNSKLQDLD